MVLSGDEVGGAPGSQGQSLAVGTGRGDLLTRLRGEFADRLASLRPLVEEYRRLDACRRALDGPGFGASE